MKSLEERKQQRAEQRALLAHGGVLVFPVKIPKPKPKPLTLAMSSTDKL